MSKKQVRKFLAATAIIGAAVAGCVVYFTKYKDFQKSLDEDFDDFEEDPDVSPDEKKEEKAEEKQEKDSSIKREYVSIPLDTPDISEIPHNTENFPEDE